MRRFYTLLLYLIAPLALVRLWWRGRRNPGYYQRWRERLGDVPPPATGPLIWIHAVSVGEAQAAQPLVRRLQSEFPEYGVLITTTTPTGAETVRRLFNSDVEHRFFPFDLPPFVARFLDRIRPSVLLIMETEIWPNLLAACEQRGIPVGLVNARMSERSARGYGWVQPLTRDALARLSFIAAQGEADVARLRDLGADPADIIQSGSLKFDIRLPASVPEQAEILRLSWGLDRHVWVAASTHDGEEEQILAVHRQVLEVFPNALLVLVPRHPERFDGVVQLVREKGFSLLRRSEHLNCEPDCQVFIGDTMGELPVFLAAADLAFIGGSLVEVGGHNLLEPAALGVPVLFGPWMFNFALIADLFVEQQAGCQVRDAAHLGEMLLAWFRDPQERARVGDNGRRVVESNRGALERVMTAVRGLLVTDMGRDRRSP
ncbi:MAG: lipid IV(A) 3-deoxy-D-manno-octulosonic acid transferase [Pseudomonadota bacterium]